MGIGKAVHFLGSALLFIAMILTIVVSVSAPVVKDITFVNLNLTGRADAYFGAFGYCTESSNGDSMCSSTRIGYNPGDILEDLDDDISFSTARGQSIRGLTRVFVLHPVSAVLLLIAFLLSLFAGSVVGSIIAMAASALAFIICIVVVAVDFAAFGLLLGEVRDHQDSNGSYSSAIWMALVAAILALLATLILFATCCTGRWRRNREKNKARKAEEQVQPQY